MFNHFYTYGTAGLIVWISGSNEKNQYGVYGIQGEPSSTNVPGSRNCWASWIDSSNNLYLFGGDGHATSTSILVFS